MDRRVAAALALVVLLPLAGCSALPVWDDGGEASTPTPSPTAPPAATATATPTPSPTPVPPESIDYPDGYGADGVADADAAAANHTETLVAADSFRFRFDVGVGSGNGTEDQFVYLARVDAASERALEVRDDGTVTRFQYYEDGRVYFRIDADEEAYNSTEQAFSAELLTGQQFVTPLLSGVDYGSPAVVETDNGTVYRYTSEEVTAPGEILPGNTSEADIERFDVVLAVHEDGYIRGARYSVVTTDGTELGAVATVDSVGATDVSRPDWYDRAAEG